MNIFQVSREEQKRVLEIIEYQFERIDGGILLKRFNERKMNSKKAIPSQAKILMVFASIYIVPFTILSMYIIKDMYDISLIVIILLTSVILIAYFLLLKMINLSLKKYALKKCKPIEKEIEKVEAVISDAKKTVAELRSYYSLPNEFCRKDTLAAIIEAFNEGRSLYQSYEYGMLRWRERNDWNSKLSRESWERAEANKQRKEITDRLDDIRNIERERNNMLSLWYSKK